MTITTPPLSSSTTTSTTTSTSTTQSLNNNNNNNKKTTTTTVSICSSILSLPPELSKIFFVLFFDLLALGLCLPVLPNLVSQLLIIDGTGVNDPSSSSSIIISTSSSSSSTSSTTTSVENLSQSSDSLGAKYYGVIVAISSLAQFFLAPIVGQLSDRKWGRKTPMAFFLYFISLYYFMLGFSAADWTRSLNTPNRNISIFVVFLAKLLSGCCSHVILLALTMISDLSHSKSKAQNFGLLGVATGMAFTIGPVIGGYLSSHIHFESPFFIGAALQLMNALFVTFFVKDSWRPSSSLSILSTSTFSSSNQNHGYHASWWSWWLWSLLSKLSSLSSSSLSSSSSSTSISISIRSVGAQLVQWVMEPLRIMYGSLRSIGIIFLNPKIKSAILPVALSLMLLTTCQQSFHTVWVLYARHKYEWNSFHAGIFMTYTGLCSVMVQGFVIRSLVPVLGEQQCASLSLLMSALINVCVAMLSRGWMLYFILPVTSLEGLAVPSLQSLIVKLANTTTTTTTTTTVATPPTPKGVHDDSSAIDGINSSGEKSMIDSSLSMSLSEQDPSIQGAIQGSISSLQILSKVFASILSTQLFSYGTMGDIESPGLSFLLGAILSLCALTVLNWNNRSPPEKTISSHRASTILSQ